jgi:hypothetical protein
MRAAATSSNGVRGPINRRHARLERVELAVREQRVAVRVERAEDARERYVATTQSYSSTTPPHHQSDSARSIAAQPQYLVGGLTARGARPDAVAPQVVERRDRVHDLWCGTARGGGRRRGRGVEEVGIRSERRRRTRCAVRW